MEGTGDSVACSHPAEMNVFCASSFEKLLSPERRAEGISPELLCDSKGTSGDSLSLYCVPRKGSVAAAGQAVTRGELAGPGVQWYFEGAEPLAWALLTLVDFPWSSKAIHFFWGMMT